MCVLFMCVMLVDGVCFVYVCDVKIGSKIINDKDVKLLLILI